MDCILYLSFFIGWGDKMFKIFIIIKFSCHIVIIDT